MMGAVVANPARLLVVCLSPPSKKKKIGGGEYYITALIFFNCEIKIITLIRFLYCHFFVFLTFHVLRFTLKHLTSWFFPFTAEQSSQRQRENLVT